MQTKEDARANHLLAVLPEEEWARLAPQLVLVDLPLGQVIYESGDRLNHVYFPTTSIISLLYVMENGASAEIAIVGNEGMVGIALFMGGETTPSRAIVQSAGTAYRLDSATVKAEFNRAGPMQRLLLRYTQALITQMAQTAVCNRHHSIEQQLCRWLLLSMDRLPTNKFEDDAGADRQHAWRAAFRRDGGSAEIAERRPDSLSPRAYRSARPARAGAARVRVLCRGQARVRSPVARPAGDLSEDQAALPASSARIEISSGTVGCGRAVWLARS